MGAWKPIEIIGELKDKVHILKEQKKNLIRYIEDNRKCGCPECRDELAEFLGKFKEVN